jgi:hypothetical protein
MGWAWYLSNDMQFFVFTPPILWAYHKFSRWVGWAWITCLIFIHVACSAYVVYDHDINLVVAAPGNTDKFFKYYYPKPYCRVGAYAIGLMMGMIVFTYRHYKANHEVYDPLALKIAHFFTKSAIARWIGGFIGVALINFCMFIQYTAYRDVDNDFNNWSKSETAAFMSMDRILLCFGLSLILMPVIFGKFDLLAEFLCAR